jgi:hypothetical protein
MLVELVLKSTAFHVLGEAYSLQLGDSHDFLIQYFRCCALITAGVGLPTGVDGRFQWRKRKKLGKAAQKRMKGAQVVENTLQATKLWLKIWSASIQVSFKLLGA